MEDQEFLKRAKIITEALEGVECDQWRTLRCLVDEMFERAKAHVPMTQAYAQQAYENMEDVYSQRNGSAIHGEPAAGCDDTVNGFEVAAYTSRLSAHPATDASHMPLPDIQP